MATKLSILLWPIIILVSILAMGCQTETEDEKCLADPECFYARADWTSGAERWCDGWITARTPGRLYLPPSAEVRWTTGPGKMFSKVFHADEDILTPEGHLRYWGNQVEIQGHDGSWQRYGYDCIYNPVSESVLDAQVWEW